jgi:hypothetical protein
VYYPRPRRRAKHPTAWHSSELTQTVRKSLHSNSHENIQMASQLSRAIIISLAVTHVSHVRMVSHEPHAGLLLPVFEHAYANHTIFSHLVPHLLAVVTISEVRTDLMPALTDTVRPRTAPYTSYRSPTAHLLFIRRSNGALGSQPSCYFNHCRCRPVPFFIRMWFCSRSGAKGFEFDSFLWTQDAALSLKTRPIG